MKWFRRVVIVVGIIAIVILLWKLDFRVVLRTVASIGFGIFFIIILEIGAQILNAIAWRLSFAPAEARAYGISELWRLWLAMDGVNYFVPTGTIAGEVARASMLNDSHPIEVRTASVVISRIGETIAQIAFVLAGFAFLASHVRSFRTFGWIATACAWLFAVVALLVLTYLLVGGRWLALRSDTPGRAGWVRAMPGQMRGYFRAHRVRFLASMCVFGAAYAWRSVEAYWICRFIGVPVTAIVALTMEVLSVAIDGALFLIPAKIGTQELGKTAIFSLLALPLSAGLAFGIIRHIREIVWALIGFGLYTAGHSQIRAR